MFFQYLGKFQEMSSKFSSYTNYIIASKNIALLEVRMVVDSNGDQAAIEYADLEKSVKDCINKN